MRPERLYLSDIVTAADTIARFLHEMDLESLMKSDLHQSALLYQLTIIGEAVSRISEPIRKRHPGIPWVDIKGFRNIVVHDYFGVDWKEVWRTATEEVPVLRTQIAHVLTAEFPDATLES